MDKVVIMAYRDGTKEERDRDLHSTRRGNQRPVSIYFLTGATEEEIKKASYAVTPDGGKVFVLGKEVTSV